MSQSAQGPDRPPWYEMDPADVAEKALAAIRDLLAPDARVIRDGQRQRVAAEDLVAGDLVVVEAGDKLPADLRLMACHNLRIDDALLTGESMAAEKSVATVSGDAGLGDRSGMAYSGTLSAWPWRPFRKACRRS